MQLRPLKRRDNVSVAQELLERIAAHVKPIIKSRHFRVGSLEEFYPTNPGLLGLNVNRGQVIRIRLRSAADDNRFLEFNDLIGTMLHELTHNVHGPHDAVFYKYLDELFSEYENAMDNGFCPDGNRLGGRQVSPEEMRKNAIAAAEKRLHLNSIMIPAGGRRLGVGSELDRIMSPGQLAAMAAERRARDSKWCGFGSDDLALRSELSATCPESLGIAGSTKRDRTQADTDLGEIVPKRALLSSAPCGSQGDATQHSAKNMSAGSHHSVDKLKTPYDVSVGCIYEPQPETIAALQKLSSTKASASESRLSTLTSTPLSIASARTTAPVGHRAVILDASSMNRSKTTVSVPVIYISDTEDDATTWVCTVCTLINTPLVLQCECCLSIRPE
ncbi:hypothetical protein BASA50_008088 [Batrachochytrium salamandrivorans]|uniref:WLM domain-containing protein n=1 Tax=Batrachochytrium salamandrivorans TaxID=1357716 RepID=A0ABQ8F5R8_9FUNG|nr:hypothetical protein BASA50_008088 [Batrachochytrium salamandrivorans]KAJ1330239.1 hypothetical protein BSLG_009658 [Batrachochytrium salamandrivorans]KAJ1337091.1 hypothetical protein BSLG_006851 [Batrachochytrium salamandrivorans]